MIKKLFVCCFLWLTLLDSVFAANIGEAAESLEIPLNLFSEFIYKICYVVGTVLVVGGLTQYKKYRDNPTAVPLSTPVMVVLLGLAIGLLPFIPHWLATTTGVKYEPLI